MCTNNNTVIKKPLFYLISPHGVAALYKTKKKTVKKSVAFRELIFKSWQIENIDLKRWHLC
jgi:tartrate dehydratase beta subunit/fumarate hydratase class I family protein